MKLLGREPHPKEIFFYHGRSSEDDVDVESILRPVRVQHLEAAAPFPDSDDDTLYVKLSWDLKTFRDAIGLTPSSVPIIKMSLMNTSRATAPSRRKESEPVTEPSLGVLAEEEDENAPKLQAGAAPRSSKRKSVVKVLSCIRKQLSFLNDQLDPNSDEDDEDEFVPSRKELQTTEEEEEEEEELDSDEEVVVK
uniref:Origin recognition complex, subunit 1 n=1 Tax=Nothobranchius kuhntae TaxID=321403 RepID=A0A1A8I931_NOTKU